MDQLSTRHSSNMAYTSHSHAFVWPGNETVKLTKTIILLLTHFHNAKSYQKVKVGV